MSAKFIGQNRWVRDRLEVVGELEQFQPNPLNVKTDFPEWVHNLLLILLGISHPGTKFKNLKKWKAKDLGKFLGRQYAGENFLHGQVPLSTKVKQEGKQAVKWAVEFVAQRNPEMDWENFVTQFESQDIIWKDKFKEFLKETLSQACDRPHIEARDFFEAFGKASVIKPDELETERTVGVGDRICWAMFLSWREIEKLGSVAELHRIFEKIGKERGIEIKYKRIEKLCQRIKLKFREGGGRPKGSKNSDKSPRSLGVVSQDR